MVEAEAVLERKEGLARRARTSRPVQSWAPLLEAKTTCHVLPPKSAPLAADLDALAQQPQLLLRIMGQKEDLGAALKRDLPASLATYILDLLDDYHAFMAPPIMRVRLEHVASRACWKWHQDYTTLRLITTLRGAGTEYLPNPNEPEDIISCATGDIGLFKGRLFGKYFGLQGHAACVHRSPAWAEGDDPRLLLVIDTPQDFEIENTVG